jgi:hypothetical protein
VAVLTGNLLKDPDYTHRYHTGTLEAPVSEEVLPDFTNPPVRVGYDMSAICAFLDSSNTA